MNGHEKPNLLERYIRDRDEDAFREIVTNYLALVESTALRRLNNDATRARDVAQIVFTDLAREAARLSSGTLLGSWLYKHTCFVASKTVRSEQRRLAREKEASQMLTNDSENTAWAEIAPLLDGAMLELSSEDQNAIVLRFFEKRDLRSIGSAFNISEDAAQKRVQRAVEKLRDALQSKGVSIGIPALSALLLSKVVLPVTAASAAAIAATALSVAPALPFLATITALMTGKVALLISAIGIIAMVAVLATRIGSKPDETLPIPANSTPAIPLTALTASKNESAIPPPPTTQADSPVNEILKSLEAGIQGIDEDQIDRALTTFWTQYDASSPQEQLQLRRAIPSITALWKNASTKLKKTILATLPRFRFATEEIDDIYIDALGRQDLAHEATAAIFLTGSSAAAATDKLIEQLKRNYRVKDTGPRESSTARMSLEALANFGAAASAAAPLLREFLTDTNFLYRVIGAKAYWQVTGDSDHVLPIFTKALRTEDSFWSAQALGQMGVSAIPAIEDLQDVYTNGPGWLRPYCYEAIRLIDRTRLPDPTGIIGALRDENPNTRMTAAQSLWEEFRNPEQVVPSLTELASRVDFGLPKPEVEPAVKLLGEIGQPAESALLAIQKLLESSTGHSGVWIAATNAWRQIAPDKPIPSQKNH